MVVEVSQLSLSDEDRETIIAWAERHPEIKSVHLFGSFARGEGRPDSDIDLALSFFPQPGDSDSFTTWMFWHGDWQDAPDLQLTHPIDIEWYEQGSDLKIVGPAVEREGVLLFSRG